MSSKGMLYAHSDVSIHVHIVWSTHRRRRRLSSKDDAWLRDFLRNKLAEHRSEALAIGNASDHVHVLATLPPTMAVAELAKSLKGASSHAWNVRSPLHRIYWQSGYWARSVDEAAVARLIPYIERQRQHHARPDVGVVDARWEQTWSPEFVRSRGKEARLGLARLPTPGQPHAPDLGPESSKSELLHEDWTLR